jgi:hypothetical protein
VTVTGAAIDPIAKTLIRADGSPTLDVMGADDAAGAVERGLTGSGATGSVALLDDVIPLDDAIAAQASAATDAARMVIELRAELDPDLYRGIIRPRRPVLVRGVGSRMSGTYYVTSVRTTLESGQLMQSFAAVRNATGLGGQEDFGQSAEEVPAT